MTIRIPPEIRFNRKLKRWLDSNGAMHLVWTGAVASSGHGTFRCGSIKNEKVYVHRFAWEMAYGPIPDDLWVLHHCDIPTCVRPIHLYLGTKDDNTRDMFDRGLVLRKGQRRFAAPPPEEFLRRVPRI